MPKGEWAKRLRTLRKTVKGLGGTSRMNDAMVDKIQNYYGIAIRRNTGNVASQVKKPPDGTVSRNEWHNHCERGANSWCKFERDIANKTKTYSWTWATRGHH